MIIDFDKIYSTEEIKSNINCFCGRILLEKRSDFSFSTTSYLCKECDKCKFDLSFFGNKIFLVRLIMNNYNLIIDINSFKLFTINGGFSRATYSIKLNQLISKI